MMGEISKREDEWQRRATAAAIAAVRKVAPDDTPLMRTPVGELSDLQWGFFIAAAIFGWITTRYQQAIAEGWDPEVEAVRIADCSPAPNELAVVRSILPALADQAAVDWSQPLSAWSKETMAGFVWLARQLLNKSAQALKESPCKILKKKPASRPEWDEKHGDPIPF
jgi:hypothetical protein